MSQRRSFTALVVLLLPVIPGAGQIASPIKDPQGVSVLAQSVPWRIYSRDGPAQASNPRRGSETQTNSVNR